MSEIERRSFLAGMAAAAAGTLLPERAIAGKGRTRVVVVRGKDVGKMVELGMARLGGFGAFVKKGKKATLKPNAAWASSVAQGGNTHPELVAACVKGCRGAGAAEVVVPEHVISPASRSFKMSGIKEAVDREGGRLYAVGDEHFRPARIPRGVALKKCDVVADVMSTGCLINLPVAKSHSATRVTLSMKNWMGSVKDRRSWHSGELDQCIADFSTLLRPDLIIVDATRVMVTGGPQGPGKVIHPEQLIFGRDPVSVDAYATTLFGLKPFDVDHIRIAHEMGVGIGDLGKIDVEEIKQG